MDLRPTLHKKACHFFSGIQVGQHIDERCIIPVNECAGGDHIIRNTATPVEYDTQRRASGIMARIERGAIGQSRTATDKYGIVGGTELVDKHRGDRGRDMTVDISIGTLGPLQGYERSMKAMGRHELAVKADALALEASGNDLDTSVTEHGNPSAGDFLERVQTADHDSRDPLGDDQFGTGGVFP